MFYYCIWQRWMAYVSFLSILFLCRARSCSTTYPLVSSCRISRWSCRASHVPRPATTPAWLSTRRARAPVIRSHCAYAVSKSHPNPNRLHPKRHPLRPWTSIEVSQVWLWTNVSVISNLILEFEWLLMYLEYGAQCYILAESQEQRQSRCVGPSTLHITILPQNPQPAALTTHVNDQDYGAMNALPWHLPGLLLGILWIWLWHRVIFQMTIGWVGFCSLA